jgi:hypothetical protein
MDDNKHAIDNARAWLSTIREMVAALKEAEETEKPVRVTIHCAKDEDLDADEIHQRIEESVLAVRIRSGWYAPGETPTPDEFEILLSTGGPALRIVGELDEYCQANNARLEWQDWGTPWTRFAIYDDGVTIQEASAAESDVLTFAQCFYFGE